MDRINNYSIPVNIDEPIQIKRVLTYMQDQINLLQGNVVNEESDVITDDEVTSIIGQVAERQVVISAVDGLSTGVKAGMLAKANQNIKVSQSDQLRLNDSTSLVGLNQTKANSAIKGVEDPRVNTKTLKDNVLVQTNLLNTVLKRLDDAGI